MLTEFEKLVKEMRAMQKAYFRTREAQTLNASKRLEKEVDKYLAAKENPQMEMFGDNEGKIRDPVTAFVEFLVDYVGGDEKMRAQLMAEKSGILNWMLDGLKKEGQTKNENMQ